MTLMVALLLYQTSKINSVVTKIHPTRVVFKTNTSILLPRVQLTSREKQTLLSSSLLVMETYKA